MLHCVGYLCVYPDTSTSHCNPPTSRYSTTNYKSKSLPFVYRGYMNNFNWAQVNWRYHQFYNLSVFDNQIFHMAYATRSVVNFFSLFLPNFYCTLVRISLYYNLFKSEIFLSAQVHVANDSLYKLIVNNCTSYLFQLAISPQPKSPNEPVTIQNDTGLTLKVEGVAVHGGRAGLFRSIHRVIVSVSSSQTSRASTLNPDAKVRNLGVFCRRFVLF